MPEIKFSEAEIKFLRSHELCRLATASGSVPHVVPVAYVYHNGFFYIATDYGTKKYKNIRKNNNVALVVDEYKPNTAVVVGGEAEILERDEEFKEIFKFFYEKFDWVRKDPWSEGEAPFIKIKPLEKASWGIK